MILIVKIEGILKEAAVLSFLLKEYPFVVMTEVTLMLYWCYRAAQIL